MVICWPVRTWLVRSYVIDQFLTAVATRTLLSKFGLISLRVTRNRISPRINKRWGISSTIGLLLLNISTCWLLRNIISLRLSIHLTTIKLSGCCILIYLAINLTSYSILTRWYLSNWWWLYINSTICSSISTWSIIISLISFMIKLFLHVLTY